jgi:hypothetical protein
MSFVKRVKVCLTFVTDRPFVTNPRVGFSPVVRWKELPEDPCVEVDSPSQFPANRSRLPRPRSARPPLESEYEKSSLQPKDHE